MVLMSRHTLVPSLDFLPELPRDHEHDGGEGRVRPFEVRFGVVLAAEVPATLSTLDTPISESVDAPRVLHVS